MSETTDWIKQRYGMTFDAIYVPPGAHLAVHITRQLAIDYEDKGRKVRYDFTLPGGVSVTTADWTEIFTAMAGQITFSLFHPCAGRSATGQAGILT